MFSTIKSSQYVAIRMPSDSIKVEQILPNTSINLGKFGTFNTNSIIGRPFYLTYEILDKAEQTEGRQLRVVKAAELHADTLLEEAEVDLQDGTTPNPEMDEYGMISTEKSNVAIFDDPNVQKLTFAEIEALKADETGSARDLIAKILASHSQLDQKTAFSLAKYTIRKHRKYLRRFTVLPIDVTTLTDWIRNEKDFSRIMEVRNEMLSLIGSWSNVHAAPRITGTDSEHVEPQCRYLVVDDTGGLIIATLAERMGILHNPAIYDSQSKTDPEIPFTSTTNIEEGTGLEAESIPNQTQKPFPAHRRRQQYQDNLATSNTLTLIHGNQQPNLNLLRYFNFDPNLPPTPSAPDQHPLHKHLKCINWLQLVDPASDPTYTEPAFKTPEEIRAMKSNAKSTYYRKRRRFERCKSIVDETRAGGFNGLVVASHTSPVSILHRLIPLLAGGAQIVVYSAHIEPLLPLVDAYSTARRTAFLLMGESEREAAIGSDEFPLDPTLTLGFTVQTARAKPWQVLPGRTHPLMMGKGGAEGYVASANRVLPVKGKIEARGNTGRRGKKRVETEVNGNGSDVVIVKADSSEEAEMENERKRSKLDIVDEEMEVVQEASVV